MKLRDLDAKLMIRRVDPVEESPAHPTGQSETWVDEPSLDQAHGIRFLCPKCWAERGGAIGTHSVVCWFEGRVPDDALPGPGRWTPSGTGIDDLTFVPGNLHHAVSVALIGGCGWHGFVKDGDAA